MEEIIEIKVSKTEAPLNHAHDLKIILKMPSGHDNATVHISKDGINDVEKKNLKLNIPHNINIGDKHYRITLINVDVKESLCYIFSVISL